MAGIELGVMYSQLKEAIRVLDEELDSLSDAESAGKRKITNELVEKSKNTWETPVENLVTQLSQMEPELQVGVYHAILRTLKEKFQTTLDEYVGKLAEAAPKVQPLITEAQAKEKSEQRSAAYQQIKHVIELAQGWEYPDSENWEMPKPRRGARGKRGKRALSYYDWFIDGNKVADDDNSVAGVYKLLGFDKAKDFTDFLRSNKIDTRTPPAEFEVTYNDKAVKAVRQEDAPSVEETSDEDENEFEEDETEETSDDE